MECYGCGFCKEKYEHELHVSVTSVEKTFVFRLFFVFFGYSTVDVRYSIIEK